MSKSNALDLFYRDSYLFAVDVPFLGVFSVSRRNVLSENVVSYLLLVLLDNAEHLFAAAYGYLDVIHYLEARIFSHGLELAYNFAHHALFDKLGGKLGVDGYGNAAVGEGEEARFLLRLYKQIFLEEGDLAYRDIQLDEAVFVQLVHSGVAPRL